VAKIRLVVADKREIFREGLAKLLESQPDIEVVCTCRTGLEAVESAYKYQPDVILMQIELSKLVGTEIMQRMHEELPKTSVIVLTCSKEYTDVFPAIKEGVEAYISKDVSLENLIKAIILVAEGGFVLSPPMAARLSAEFNFLEQGKDAVKLVTLLSKREQAVLSLVERGFTNREIASTLFISENTVKVHLRNLMEKLNAHTRQQAVSLIRGIDLPTSVYPKVTKASVASRAQDIS